MNKSGTKISIPLKVYIMKFKLSPHQEHLIYCWILLRPMSLHMLIFTF